MVEGSAFSAKPGQTLGGPEVAANLSLSSSDMGLFTKAGRVGEVTSEGLLKTPLGMWHAIGADLKPENWGKDAELVGTSVAMGVAMRTLLPEGGAVAATAGLVMGGMFVLDAVKPMWNAWGKVTSDSSDKAMSQASTMMGEGLGTFAIDGGISMLAAGVAAKKTPDLWKSLAPEKWSAIESWKARNLAGTAPIASMLGSLGTGIRTKMTGFADTIDPPKPSVRSLSTDQLAQVADGARSNLAADMRSESMYRNGMKGIDGGSHGLDTTVELLLAGKDPITVPSTANGIDGGRLTSLTGIDLTHPDGINVIDAKGRQPVPDVLKTGDQTAGTGSGGGATTEAQRILNAKTMTAQGAVTRAVLGQVPDEVGMVMDAVNRTTGAVEVRTNPDVKPLTGYEEPRAAMLSLAQQVNAEPGAFVQVGDLFSRFADAAIQSGTADVSDIGQHIGRFNRYGQENFRTYEQNIIKAGIDPQVALERKVVPPLGEVTSDVEQVGVDKAGNPVYAHQGPHTVRAIYGPNGEPVWPIDMVKYPIREMGMRGVQTSGIYGHEYM
ncbi:MAG: hypothetical protein ACRD3W_25305, partial [Terriglobales bacterium]